MEPQEFNEVTPRIPKF